MPAAYLGLLRTGGTLMLLASFPLVASALWFTIAVRFDFSRLYPTCLGVASSMLWAASVWLLLTPRPSEAYVGTTTRKEGNVCRRMSRVSQLLWLLAFSSVGIGMSIANVALTEILHALAFVMFIVAFVGVWPLCIDLARLSTWIEDDDLANRLRLLPWVLVVSTIGAATISIVLPYLGGGVISFLLMPIGAIFGIAVLIGIGLFVASFMQFGTLARWILLNREESLAADRRRIDRAVAKATVPPGRPSNTPSSPPTPERVWTGPATRKPQGNYLPRSDSVDSIPLEPPPLSDTPPNGRTK